MKWVKEHSRQRKKHKQMQRTGMFREQDLQCDWRQSNGRQDYKGWEQTMECLLKSRIDSTNFNWKVKKNPLSAIIRGTLWEDWFGYDTRFRGKTSWEYWWGNRSTQSWVNKTEKIFPPLLSLSIQDFKLYVEKNTCKFTF